MNAERDLRRKLRRLILAHVAAGLGCAAAVDVNASVAMRHSGVNAIFTALIGSELCLLGLGLAVAFEKSGNRNRRLALAGAGTLWVWMVTFTVLGLAKPVPPPAFILFLAPMVSLAAWSFGFALRAWGIRLIRSESPAENLREAFQFTLRHLLGLTAAVAALLAIGRAIRAFDPQHAHRTSAFAITALIVMCIVTATIVMTTLWAVLGSGRPLLRLPVAVALAAVAGLVPAFYFAITPLGYMILAGVAALLSLVTAESLFVVRHCGYRLVRKTSDEIVGGASLQSQADESG